MKLSQPRKEPKLETQQYVKLLPILAEYSYCRGNKKTRPLDQTQTLAA